MLASDAWTSEDMVYEPRERVLIGKNAWFFLCYVIVLSYAHMIGLLSTLIKASIHFLCEKSVSTDELYGTEFPTTFSAKIAVITLAYCKLYV